MNAQKYTFQNIILIKSEWRSFKVLLCVLELINLCQIGIEKFLK